MLLDSLAPLPARATFPIDRMLCSPALRSEFLNAARQVIPASDEEDILVSLLRLRKKKALPRTER